MNGLYKQLKHSGLIILTLAACACGGGGGGGDGGGGGGNPNPPSSSPIIRTINLGMDKLADEGSDGGSTDFEFTVTLNGPADGDITFDYDTTFVTTEAEDFIDSTGSVTIADGETEATIVLGVVADTAFELDESFTLTLSNASANASIGKGEAFGLIYNDDPLDIVMHLIYLGEGDATLDVLTAELGYDLLFDVDEFLRKLGLLELELPFDIYYDDEIHLPWLVGSGTLRLRFGEGNSGRFFVKWGIGGPSLGLGNNLLINIDWSEVLASHYDVKLEVILPIEKEVLDPDVPLLTLEGPDLVTEGDTGESTDVTFELKLSEALTSDIEITYKTLDSAAISPDDFLAVDSSVTIPAGDTQTSFTVTITGDDVEEDTEVFYIAIGTTYPGVFLDNPLGVLPIYDNDAEEEPRIVRIANVELVEGDSGTTNMEFEITLDAASTSFITVQYRTFDETAEAGIDYEQTGGQHVFIPGETRFPVSVPIIGDTLPEDDETFNLQILTVIGNATAGQSGIGTILTDDPIARVNVQDLTLAEGDIDITSFAFSVTLSEAVNVPLEITYNTSDLSALTGEDYSSASGSITIDAGDTQGFIEVLVNGDTENESDESFQLTINVDNDAAILQDGIATGTILNDDSAGGWAGEELVHLASTTAFAGRAYRPQVAFAANGDKHVIYLQNNSIWHRVSPARGTWLDEMQVASLGSMIYSPQLALDPAGSALTVWQNTTVQSAKLAPTDEWLTEPLPQDVEVYNEIRLASEPSTGEATIVWTKRGDSSNAFLTDIWSATFIPDSGSSPGWQDMAEVESLSDYAANPEIAMSGENIITVFTVAPPSPATTNIVAYWKSGSSWSGPTVLDSVTEYHASNPKVDVNAQGDAAVVWHQEEPVLTGIARRSIYVNRYTAATSTWSGAELVESTTTHVAEFPDVAIDDRGNVFVIWLQQSLDLSTQDLHGRRYNVITDTWADSELLELDDTASGFPISSHQIVADDMGDTIVVFLQNDGNLVNLRATRYSYEESRWLPSELIEELDGGDATLPHLVMDRVNGHAMVVWSQVEGSNNNIWANRYTR